MSKHSLLVLGGTGSCGQHFVGQALDAGHGVRLLTRNPSRVTADAFPWAEHAELELVAGDLTDADAVAQACEGVSAVVSLAGSPRGAKTSVMPTAIRNVAAGMRAHGVRRLIVQTGGFVHLDGEKAGLFERGARAMFGTIMREGATLRGNDEVADFLQHECPDLDWTITRPGMLDDGPSRGQVEAAFDYGPGMPSDHPSKVDLTAWYVRLLDEPKSFHTAPAPQYVSGGH